jgi:hypothetical protein
MISVSKLVTVWLPEIPVTVTVYCPGAVAVLACSTISELKVVPFTGFGLNDAVTPFGSPDTDNATLPVKPFER